MNKLKINNKAKKNTNKRAYSHFFNNLSSPLRIEIIDALKNRDLSVNQLCEQIGDEQSKISHALANLRECQLVRVKQNGKNRVYSLNKKTLLPILEIIDNHSLNNCGSTCLSCNKCY